MASHGCGGNPTRHDTLQGNCVPDSLLFRHMPGCASKSVRAPVLGRLAHCAARKCSAALGAVQQASRRVCEVVRQQPTWIR